MRYRSFEIVVLFAVAGLLAASAPRCAADELLLATGGKITGQVEELTTDAGRQYRVTTALGTVVALAADQVEKHVRHSAEHHAYQARATAAPDTVEGQLAMANWCREHKLSDEAARHAKRVVELDPSNADARRMLNFKNIDGEWQTREQIMQARGLIWSEGKYRSRQEIALREQAAKMKQLEVHWNGEIKKWKRWLGDRRADRVAEAVANFNGVTHPLAGPPIVEMLEDEQNPATRRLLAKAAARINHQSTVNALADLVVKDPDPELRYLCLESLRDSGRPGLVPLFVKGLRAKQNVIVNRSAEVLAELGDPSAISPLIDALVTKHKRVLNPGNSSGGDTYSLDTASGGFSFGGGGPKVQTGTFKNPDVLTALVKLSGGENYNYDKALWRRWYATQAQMVQVDLRRDE